MVGRRAGASRWASAAALVTAAVVTGCTSGPTPAPSTTAGSGSGGTASVAAGGPAPSGPGGSASAPREVTETPRRWRETILVNPEAIPPDVGLLRASRPVDLPTRLDYGRSLLAVDAQGRLLVVEGYQASGDYEVPKNYAAGIGVMSAFGGRPHWLVPVPRRREVPEGVAVGDLQGPRAVWALSGATSVRIMTASTTGSARVRELARIGAMSWPTLVLAGDDLFRLQAEANAEADWFDGPVVRLSLSDRRQVSGPTGATLLVRDECAPSNRPRVAFLRQTGTHAAPGPVQVWVWEAGQDRPQPWWDAGALPIAADVDGLAMCGDHVVLTGSVDRGAHQENPLPSDALLVSMRRGDPEVEYQLLAARSLQHPQLSPSGMVLSDMHDGGGDVFVVPTEHPATRLPRGDGCEPAVLRGDVLVWSSERCQHRVVRLPG